MPSPNLLIYRTDDTLGFSDTRTSLPPDEMVGTAYKPVQHIELLANWALISTAALLWIQAIVTVYHLRNLGGLRLDFSLLQIMAMSTSPPETNALTQHGREIPEGVGIGTRIGESLVGFCSGQPRPPAAPPSPYLSVRQRQITGPSPSPDTTFWHLEFVKSGDERGSTLPRQGPWQAVTSGSKVS